MAKINSILTANERQLDISAYINPEEKDYITIRKLPYSIKRKIEFMAMNSLNSVTGKALFAYMKKKGLALNKIDELTDDQRTEIMLDINIKEDEINNLISSTIELSKTIIDNGIDPDKHTFIDDNDKPLKLNFEILDSLRNDKLIDYIVDNIRKYSEGYDLGE